MTGVKNLDQTVAETFTSIDVGITLQVSESEMDWYLGYLEAELKKTFKNAGIRVSRGDSVADWEKITHSGPARQNVFGQSYHHSLLSQELDRIFVTCKWEMK